MDFLIKVFFSFILCVFIHSCTDPYAKVEQLEAKVIEIHDEVMPKTGTIHKLKKELRASLSPQSDSTKVFDLVKNLSDADEAMKIWMEEYIGADQEKSIEENMVNLENQKNKMMTVRDLMLNSIDEASTYLKQ